MLASLAKSVTEFWLRQTHTQTAPSFNIDYSRQTDTKTLCLSTPLTNLYLLVKYSLFVSINLDQFEKSEEQDKSHMPDKHTDHSKTDKLNMSDRQETS